MLLNYRGLWHGCLVNFVNIANYTSLSVKELSVNKETTCKRQNHSFLSTKYTCQALYQTLFLLTNNKNELLKTVRLTSFQETTISIRFNLLQVCPSVSNYIFAVLFYLFFYCFEWLFLCFSKFSSFKGKLRGKNLSYRVHTTYPLRSIELEITKVSCNLHGICTSGCPENES